MKREVKIGLTGIVALVILFLGINFLKGVQLFNVSHTYYIAYKNAKGLTKSSTVFADGYNIGIVSDVQYERPGRVVVEISVQDGVKIPHGTKATLTEGMLGGCTLNLLMGCNPADCYQPGDTITGCEQGGLMDVAADVMPKVQEVLEHVDSLVMTLNKLASDPSLPQTLHNAEALTANLNESTRQLDKLLHNDIPQLTTTINQVGENAVTLTDNLAQINIQQTLDKVDRTMENLQQTTLKLQTPDNNIGLMLNDSSLYNNLNSTINSATELLQDMKTHPKRYINVSVFGGKKEK